MIAALVLAAGDAVDLNGGLLVAVLVALLIAALVYWVASLFLPHPIPVIAALIVLVLLLLA